MVVGSALMYAAPYDALPLKVVPSTPIAVGAGYAAGLGGVVMLLYRVTHITESTLLRVRHNERAPAESYRELQAEIAERKRIEPTSRER
jgi:hypothetical protein